MDSKEEKQNKKEAPKKPVPAEQRSFLATFLLVLSLGQFGANRIYTGDTTVGYVRLVMSIAGFILSPIVIGIPLIIIAQIWGFIDIFMVYHGARVDADGMELFANERDKKAAKILYIVFWVFLALLIAFILLMVVIAITIGLNSDASGASLLNADYNMN